MADVQDARDWEAWRREMTAQPYYVPSPARIARETGKIKAEHIRAMRDDTPQEQQL